MGSVTVKIGREGVLTDFFIFLSFLFFRCISGLSDRRGGPRAFCFGGRFDYD